MGQKFQSRDEFPKTESTAPDRLSGKQ